MPGTVIAGAQWGDEGKAKVIDYLTERSDVIVRHQGGANAGHTVIARGTKFIFHLVPSGIMYPDKVCVVGNGVVLDAEQFLREVDELSEEGIDAADRLFVSDQAHLVLPYHSLQDKTSEAGAAGNRIGTTGRGIGPAYADKALRTGLRVGELHNWDRFVERLSANFEAKRVLIEKVYEVEFDLKLGDIVERYRGVRDRMEPFVRDTCKMIYDAWGEGKRLLFEGAQGTFLDIDHGTYPFVTSSNTVSGSACAGSGIGPTAIDDVVGIVKTYTTRVGNGPFPTELDDATGELLRRRGAEFGATTGRPRRCGWFDTVMIRKAVRLNGLTRLAFTKLDVLDELDEIKVCTHYEIDGRKTEDFPSDPSLLSRVSPVYETLPGWKQDLKECVRFSDLPENAVKYINRMRELCCAVPALIVSVGPQRRQTIEVEPL